MIDEIGCPLCHKLEAEMWICNECYNQLIKDIFNKLAPPLNLKSLKDDEMIIWTIKSFLKIKNDFIIKC